MGKNKPGFVEGGIVEGKGLAFIDIGYVLNKEESRKLSKLKKNHESNITIIFESNLKHTQDEHIKMALDEIERSMCGRLFIDRYDIPKNYRPS